MMKWTFALLLAVLVLFATVATILPATAEVNAADIAQMTPFTAEANYMSLAGKYRLEGFRETGIWVFRLEAVQAIKEVGGDATLGCRDAMTLNGCKPPVGG